MNKATPACCNCANFTSIPHNPSYMICLIREGKKPGTVAPVCKPNGICIDWMPNESIKDTQITVDELLEETR